MLAFLLACVWLLTNMQAKHPNTSNSNKNNIYKQLFEAVRTGIPGDCLFPPHQGNLQLLQNCLAVLNGDT
jgi:hypothetical protein